MSQRNKSCEECGCLCGDCTDQVGLHLHVEIENLKQQLIERENHILKMETNFLKETDKFPNGEVAAISEELLAWQDKYSRLYEAHKRVQRVNQNLEDKLLRIVDKCETEKNALTTEVSNLTRRLVDEKFTVARLQEENERYRNDVNLAIQLLQCKPSNFVSQRYDALPTEMQQKVRTYLSSKRRQSDGNGNVAPKSEMKTIKVPIPTYPPTAMVYSVNKATLEKEGGGEEKINSQPVDIVSAAIMGKILEERERERSQAKHCGTCSCPKTKCSKSTQTLSDLNCMEACINAPPKRPTPVCCPMTVRSRALNNGLELWDKNGGDSNNVAEGILVNIDSGGESSSLNSECSSRQEEDLISFERLERLGGPRHCSVRLQPGSNNILLDNVVDPFTPVLYKGRQASGALVHLPRCTSSSSSSGDEHPVSRRLVPKTETEI